MADKPLFNLDAEGRWRLAYDRQTGLGGVLVDVLAAAEQQAVSFENVCFHRPRAMEART